MAAQVVVVVVCHHIYQQYLQWGCRWMFWLTGRNSWGQVYPSKRLDEAELKGFQVTEAKVRLAVELGDNVGPDWQVASWKEEKQLEYIKIYWKIQELQHNYSKSKQEVHMAEQVT